MARWPDRPDRRDIVLGCLLALLAFGSDRWRTPRSYLGPRGAAGLAAIIMALILLRLVVD